MNKLMFTLCALLISTVLSNAHAQSKSEVENLSAELRGLLKQEMVAIEAAMQKIVPAFAAGNLDEVSALAGKISNSFILKQKITEAQKHELHEKLSKGFIVKDQQFHKYAGMLEHVSEKRHTELVGFYYSKLLESCVGCHSGYATHQFPRFANEPSQHEHHH
jgi:hypothetical protein